VETLDAYDLGTLYFFGSLHRPWLNALAKALTHLGDTKVLIAVTLVAAMAFLVVRRRRFAGIVVLVAVLAHGVERLSKITVGRKRPDVAWRLVDLPSGASFPSGHALDSMAIYGCVALLTARLVSAWWRVAVIAGGVGLSLLIGLTRPYLGVHYPFDVLAGWIAGLAFAFLGSALADPPSG
jgi:undecaprenyl-diphosphatase